MLPKGRSATETRVGVLAGHRSEREDDREQPGCDGGVLEKRQRHVVGRTAPTKHAARQQGRASAPSDYPAVASHRQGTPRNATCALTPSRSATASTATNVRAPLVSISGISSPRSEPNSARSSPRCGDQQDRNRFSHLGNGDPHAENLARTRAGHDRLGTSPFCSPAARPGPLVDGRSSTAISPQYRVLTKGGLPATDAADRSGRPANFTSRSAAVPRLRPAKRGKGASAVAPIAVRAIEAATGPEIRALQVRADPQAQVGSPGALQPPAPTDPGVTVSRHPALLIRLLVNTGRSVGPSASGRRGRAVVCAARPTTPRSWSRSGAVDISSQPSASGSS